MFCVQLAIAGLLIATSLIDAAIFPVRDVTDLADGPISPGDQTRIYRTDKTSPDLFKTGVSPGIPMPNRFSDQLQFSEHVVEGLGTVLLMSGGIGEGDVDRVRRHLEDWGTAPDLVALHSPGGLVHEALEIGRLFRERAFSTAVLAGGFCASACPYVLAGGAERIVSNSGIVGLHQHYYEAPKLLPVFLAVEGIQMGQGQTMAFLIEMGVDPSVMVHALMTPPEQIYALVESQLIETRLATSTID